MDTSDDINLGPADFEESMGHLKETSSSQMITQTSEEISRWKKEILRLLEKAGNR